MIVLIIVAAILVIMGIIILIGKEEIQVNSCLTGI